jgi:hypothetical protein
MSTYAIVVDGPDGTFDITSNSHLAVLTRRLGDAASLSIECHEMYRNHAMDAVTLTVDGIVRFRGTVKRQADTRKETIRISRLECVDDSDKLQRRLVLEVFTDQTPKQMIESIITDYASWVTSANVQDVGGAVESMVFDYDSVAIAIQKIADLVGAYWYLDEDNDLHFFTESDGGASTTYDSRINMARNSFTLDTTAVDLANRVWVLGSKTAATNYLEQQWVGDDTTQVFSLAYVPNYPEVYENEVQKTIEVEKGETSSEDYVYNKKEKALRRVAGPLGNGIPLRFKYRPTTQIIDYFEDSGSVATYGLYEKAIRDRKITDKAAARKRGKSELKRTKSVQRVCNWRTRDWEVAPGQIASIVVPPFNLVADIRIEEMDVTFTPGDIVATLRGTAVAETVQTFAFLQAAQIAEVLDE